MAITYDGTATENGIFLALHSHVKFTAVQPADD